MKRSYLRRSDRPLRRSGFKRLSFDEAKIPQLNHQGIGRLRRTCRLNANGRRTQDWRKVWRFLKAEFEKAGRTGCEFGFLAHDCGGALDPAHSKKRNKMQNLDIYAVAMACRTVHNYLDGLHVYPPLGRRMDHAEMEAAVLTAINNSGGLILPERKAA